MLWWNSSLFPILQKLEVLDYDGSFTLEFQLKCALAKEVRAEFDRSEHIIHP